MMKKLITGEEIYCGDFGEFSIGVDTPPGGDSSAGWKNTLTMPLISLFAEKYLDISSAIAIWQSCPQACMKPEFLDLYTTSFFSVSCKAPFRPS